LSAKDLLGGRTQILNVSRIKKIDRHPAESDEDSAPESIPDTENWLYWNGDLDKPTVSEDYCEADDESDLEQDNVITDSEPTVQRDVSVAPNVPRLIRPTRKSKRQAEKVIMTVSAMETRRNKGNKRKLDSMRKWFFTWIFILFDQECHLEKVFGRIMSSPM